MKRLVLIMLIWVAFAAEGVQTVRLSLPEVIARARTNSADAEVALNQLKSVKDYDKLY